MLKKKVLTGAVVAAFSLSGGYLSAQAPALDDRLEEATLRVDYIFSGTDKECSIAVDGLSRLKGWAGRRVRMREVPLRGNGQICMTTVEEGDTLYRMSFSTLFQEWQATEEATLVRKGFENVFLLPMPSVPVNVTVTLFDFHGGISASLVHPVDPDDILIRPIGGYSEADVMSYLVAGNLAREGERDLSSSSASSDENVQTRSRDGIPSRYIHYSGSPTECIDVAIVAEGYTSDEMDVFYADAQSAVESLFNHAPFASLQDRFNIIAVAAPSDDSGVSVPRNSDWKSTAVGSHFDTFYSDRYLTTLRLKQLHDILKDVPYEHIIILANTDTYGGGGIFNSYTLTTAHHRQFRPVVVHEFGHSFAGLADEYFYDDQYSEQYFPEVEPWEPNITTLADFSSKWLDMLPAGTVLPNGELVQATPERQSIFSLFRKRRNYRRSIDGVGLYEGGGYQSKGVWRGSENCRMRTNEHPAFCPVCQQAIADIIHFYTSETELSD